MKKNDIKKFPTDTLKAIAKVLRTTPEYLMGWDDDPRDTDIPLVVLEHFNGDVRAARNFEDQVAKDALSERPNDSNISEICANNIFNIPVYNSVSAGFGAYASSDIIGYQPVYFENTSETEETLCINVKGDSMYPTICEGDTIQVRKQTSVDSGSIAVVLLDGEEGLVKKVVYGDDWIELHSINPEYMTKRFEGADVLRLQVVGLVRTVIKHL